MTGQDYRAAIESMGRDYETLIRVRYGETDCMGYVYYGNYALYFEQGRTEMMRCLGIAYAEIESRGVMMPVVDMAVHYVEAARYDALLRVYSGILEMGPASVTFGYRIFVGDGDAEREKAWGHTRLAFVDAQTRRPVRVPGWVRERAQEAL